MHDCSVEIQIDNTTAVSYINKLGGCKSKPLCDISLRIATWCEERNLFLFAIFVPGVLNTLADAESRRPVSSGDWKLSPLAFASIAETWSVQVDLFASDWNKQLSKFAIWFPHPGAWKVDAFNLHWKGLNAYCFPLFNLIPFCLTKILQEEAELVLVTPYWPRQLWFPPPRTGTINRHTPSSPTSSGPIDFSFGGESSSSTERLDQTSRSDALRRNFEERGLSEDAIALVLSATRTNTRTAYQSAWNAWRSWCCSREKDPLSAGIHDVLNFLADFQKGRS